MLGWELEEGFLRRFCGSGCALVLAFGRWVDMGWVSLAPMGPLNSKHTMLILFYFVTAKTEMEVMTLVTLQKFPLSWQSKASEV
jgi:hypothetical protein